MKITRIIPVLCSFIVVISALPPVYAVDSTAALLAGAESRLRAVYETGEFADRPFRAAWLPDSSGYTSLEPSSGTGVRELVRYDAASGERTVLIPESRLVSPGAAEPITIEDYAFSLDGSRVLLMTNERQDDKNDLRIADFHVFDLRSGSLQDIVTGADAVSMGYGFSPDGRRVLYAAREDLIAYDLKSRRTIPLTTDGVINAVSNSRALWSPDGARIAYVQADSSAVGLRPMIDPDEPTYPEVRWSRFARAGSPIPSLRVGVVGADGGPKRWIPIPAAAADFYIGQLYWTNDGELLVEVFSRVRDAREFLLADIRTGTVTTLYKETDPAWVAGSRGGGELDWFDGGKKFVLLSEKDGWRHAYIGSRGGAAPSLLTPGPGDIIARVKVDEKKGWFYYLASPENATQKYLFRIRLDGTGKPKRVTPADQPGTHTYDFSPDARWAFHTYSTFDSPPRTELVEMSEHRVVRVLEDNGALRAKLASWIPRPTEFFKLDIGGGVVMDAWMIKPRDFDPAEKYPLFIYVYGEPAIQTVLDDWYSRQGHRMFHRVIADLGYLVVSIDNRGTPAPKGAGWRRAGYPNLGPLSTEEQAAGLQALCRHRPYIDPSRIGIWGRSAGGTNTLNALFRKPDLYHVGIAVVPKPQPHLYSAGFQEIFMRTPQENPKGYAESAPINFAEGLKGDLLIIHGTGETNTHLQIVEGLVDRLIELGKRFDYMAYPNRNHELLEGRGMPLHLRMLMTRYLIEHLPPGPR